MLKITFRDKLLAPLWDKILNGERLTLSDGLTLYRSEDLIALGRMAAEVNWQRNGDAVYFSLNQKIEPSNICLLKCRFCAFSVRPDDAGAYELSIPEILAKIPPGIQEVHITGALHPQRTWDYYLAIVAEIRRAFPQVGIKAYTAVEIDYFHRRFGMSVTDVLRKLKAAGLDSLPGGGAEIFSERIRKHLFRRKMGAKKWLAIHRAAHLMGIPTNATMLYGHLETLEERLVHLILLRELQDQTGGFSSFVPLPFQVGRGGSGLAGRFRGLVDDLKTIAISRLMLDNFPHIKAYWVMLTPEVASLALNFGADDLDGTVGGEKIAHDAGAASPQSLAREELLTMIAQAKRIAVSRDVFYQPLWVEGNQILGKVPYLNSVPFYHYFPRNLFPLLPTAPRRLGVLFRQGEIDGGLFSLRDYLDSGSRLTMLNYCIASPQEVGSVLLFSRLPWPKLAGKEIGITDDTATSVQLLQVLLEKRYRVAARLTRICARKDARDRFSAILLIGDEALKRKKTGLSGYPLVYDLAAEWYAWQSLPFVFAVWAVRRDWRRQSRDLLAEVIETSLQRAEKELPGLAAIYGRKLGLDPQEATSYLEAFQYRLREREKEAIIRFQALADE